jgi:hypothetical protein
MNVDDLITHILTRLDELTPLTPIHWTRTEILVFVNDALTELNLIAWEFQNSASLAVDTTESIFDTPATIFAAISIIDQGRYLRREPLADLDHEDDWDLPWHTSSKCKEWCPVGLNLILIHPRSTISKTLTVEGLIEHTPVTDTAMALPVLPEMEPAIEDFAIERAKFKEGGQVLNQAGAMYQAFLDSVQILGGKNVIKMYPSYSYGLVNDESLRDIIEDNQK